MKDERKDHTGQVNQLGRRHEVGGEGKFLGTSYDVYLVLQYG